MSIPGKILILYASFGAGHRRAAHAIMEGLLKINPKAQADVLDYFIFTNSTMYNLVRRTYFKSISVAPALWGKLYHRTSHISGSSPINKVLNKIGRKNFIEYLQFTAPDAVITTYPVPAGVLSELKGQGLFITPVITAITDYGVHSQWLHPHTDLYLVGAGCMKDYLHRNGIPAEKVFVSGIPVSPVFEKNLSRSALCARLGLNPAVPTVLIMSGASGDSAAVKKACTRLARTPANLQLLVVCGRDAGMYNELLKTIQTSQNRVKIYPFVENIHELMTVSDLIVTKAGGLTVSEALVKQLPMILFRPLPGQEEENTRYLTASGAALAVQKDAGQLADAVLSLVANPLRLAAMSAAAGRIRQVNSAVRAAQRINALIKAPGISDFA